MNELFGHSKADFHLRQMADTVRNTFEVSIKNKKIKDRPLTFRLQGKEVHIVIVVPDGKSYGEADIVADLKKAEIRQNGHQ